MKQDNEDKSLNLCSKCNDKFENRETLINHASSEHRDENKKVPCPYPGCKTAIVRPDKLKIHYKVCHEKSESYQCSYCDKHYATKKSLMKHVETAHEGNKPHKCSFCYVKFSDKNEFKEHVANFHQGRESQKEW